VPVGGQRDPEETRKILLDWLGRQMPDAHDLAIPELEIPQASGFSNETFLFEATWKNGGPQRARLVLRAQPQEYGLFPKVDIIEQQYRTMMLLGEHSDVPVPRVRWAEPDPDVLGQPFFVMDRVEGQVPGDNPPYTSEGFIVELPPARRRALHESGLDAMTRIHKVDWRAIGFDHLDRPEFGKPGPTQLRGYFQHFVDWALDGEPHPVIDRAWERLCAEWPDDGEHVDLTWGDARIGNQMFRNQLCVAVFDWEMSALANAESDLGWWCFMQRFHTEGMGGPLPEGLLDRSETVALWEQKIGRPALHVDFYELLGGFHFCLIMVMMGRSMARLMPDFPADFGQTNPGVGVLATIVERASG